MNKTILASVMGAGMILLSGCLESTTVIRVKKDGSGEILVREFMSTEVTSMMQSAQGMMDQGATAGEKDTTKLPLLMQGMLDEKIEQFGSGVKLAEVKEATNARGWKGYQARMTFADANTLRISGASEGKDGPKGPELSYRFEFEPGSTATLRLIPEGDAAATAASMEMDLPEMEEEMTPMMMAMMAPMLEGMKVGVFLQVEGSIVDTDANHRDPARNNIVTLMDIDFAQIGDNPEILKLMTKRDPAALEKLRDQEIPGFRVQDEKRSVTIRFK